MAEPTKDDLDLAETILLDEVDGYEPTKWAIGQALADQRETLEAGYREGYATLLDVRGMVQTWLHRAKADDRETLDRIAARLGLS